MIKLKLKANTLPVEIEKDGVITAFELREMSAALRDAYLDTLGKRITTDAAGKPTVTNFGGMQGELLSRCLFEADKKESVTMSEVQSWPASVVASLFTEAQKLNLLNAQAEKSAETVAKND